MLQERKYFEAKERNEKHNISIIGADIFLSLRKYQSSILFISKYILRFSIEIGMYFQYLRFITHEKQLGSTIT